MMATAQVRFITSSFLSPETAGEQACDEERAEERTNAGRNADRNRSGSGSRSAVQWLDLELLEAIECQVTRRLRHARGRLHGDAGAVDKEQRRPETIAVAGADPHHGSDRQLRR